MKTVIWILIIVTIRLIVVYLYYHHDVVGKKGILGMLLHSGL